MWIVALTLVGVVGMQSALPDQSPRLGDGVEAIKPEQQLIRAPVRSSDQKSCDRELPHSISLLEDIGTHRILQRARIGTPD